jgi:penicillin-binding protein 1A
VIYDEESSPESWAPAPRKTPRTRLERLLQATVFCAAAGFGGLVASWFLVCRGDACPSVASLGGYVPRQTSKLYAADGRFIAELGLERRTVVPIADVPKVVTDAFLLTEDKRFYSHSGIDLVRVVGSVFTNLRSLGFAQGFSTITMQLARNIFPERLSREKSIIRKLKEMRVALEIEARFSKDRILELYLNQINLGSGAYGVETAAQRYFGKRVTDLNIAEAATLAAIPKAPGRYNPRRSPDRSIQRRNTVIELMRRGGAISDAEASLAKAYPLKLAQRSESGDVAPYFVEWVRLELEKKFGQALYERGLRVTTSLDIDMQSAAERAVEAQLRVIESGKLGKFPHQTYEQYLVKDTDGASSGTNAPYLQGAFVALDPRTGAVRAMVGGRDYGDSKFNRATQALRQPGSTFKPIVYAAAVRNGRGPSYPVDDSPIEIPQEDGTIWAPQNFDEKFLGGISLRRALFMSRNLAAIRTGQEVGVGEVRKMAKAVGLSTPIPPYPSMYIGSADVYPLEMINAYSAFANLGRRTVPHGVLKVESSDGKVVWDPSYEREDALSTEEAWLMVDMMQDVIRRGTASKAVQGAGFNVPAGGKTGTTNDGADVWFIGYTADLVAGVWMGFDKPTPIKEKAAGGDLAAPAWTTFMKEVYSRKPSPPDWPRPSGIIVRELDAESGRLPGPECAGGRTYSEYFIVGREPTSLCGPRAPTDSAAAPAAESPTTQAQGVSARSLPPLRSPR